MKTKDWRLWPCAKENPDVTKSIDRITNIECGPCGYTKFEWRRVVTQFLFLFRLSIDRMTLIWRWSSPWSSTCEQLNWTIKFNPLKMIRKCYRIFYFSFVSLFYLALLGTLEYISLFGIFSSRKQIILLLPSFYEEDWFNTRSSRKWRILIQLDPTECYFTAR